MGCQSASPCLRLESGPPCFSLFSPLPSLPAVLTTSADTNIPTANPSPRSQSTLEIGVPTSLRNQDGIIIHHQEVSLVSPNTIVVTMVTARYLNLSVSHFTCG